MCLSENKRTKEQVLKDKLRFNKRNAIENGIPFSITINDLKPFPIRCPILGVKLVYESNVGRRGDMASIDRIIPSLGYVPGNVAIMSLRANRLKNNASLEEVRSLLKWMESKLV